MKLFVKFICKLIPGLVFIFSGFMKAVDPVGGAIKFQDYFTAFHLEWLSPVALPLAILLSAIEFLLGFYLLLNLYMRYVVPAAFALLSVFTVLTLYIAIFNPVSDCGCFGDAITLTNWQTFWKNVVVMVFASGLLFLRREYQPIKGNIRNLATAIALAVYIVGVSVYSYNNLPIFDFRPFKTGNNIREMMEIPEGAEMTEFETLFVLERNGERQTFTLEDYPFEDTTWVYVDSETKIIKEGYIPPLQTFSLLDPELGDVTQEIISHSGPLFMVIAPRIGNVAESSVMQLAELAETARQKDVPFYIVTASGANETFEFDIKHNTMFRFLQTDETTLKTIIRSNPGLVLLYDGTVTAKWHYRDLPDTKILNNPLTYAVSAHTANKAKLLIWAHILGLILLPMLIISIKTTK
jgi:hypothetical protein